MKSLLINTSIHLASVVLIENSTVVSKVEEYNTNDLSTKVFFMLDNVLKESKCDLKDLNKIFVVNGPGSFTGIRIGLTIAKTVAWSLGIDLIPLSSLELMASSSNELTVSLIDARRGYVYAGVYDHNLNSILEDQYISLEELKKVCDNYKNLTFVSYEAFDDLEVKEPQIDYVKIIQKHECDVVRNCHTISPTYLKLTEAEEKRLKHEN